MDGEISFEELTTGDYVTFGRPESRRDPAFGEIVKVNRQTYTVKLVSTWFQVKRTYAPGSKFRVSKGMVSRYMGNLDGEIDL